MHIYIVTILLAAQAIYALVSPRQPHDDQDPISVISEVESVSGSRNPTVHSSYTSPDVSSVHFSQHTEVVFVTVDTTITIYLPAQSSSNNTVRLLYLHFPVRTYHSNRILQGWYCSAGTNPSSGRDSSK